MGRQPMHQWQTAHAPMAYGVGHPTTLKYTKIFAIKDSRQVGFLSFLLLPCGDEENGPSKPVKKKLSPEMMKKKLSSESQRKKMCPNF